jgi:hypothetical protein
MPIAYKVLGSSAPSSTAKVNLYTVPAGKQAIVSSLVVTATFSSGTQTFNVHALSAAGDTATNNNSLGSNLTISANSHIAFTEGWTLNAGETIAVISNTGSGINFYLFGSEIS